ncbi:IclR family transcriptional regulator [Arthrobacter sp. D2-10]
MQNKALPPYAVESVSNALRILILFREHDIVRVTDAAKELGVARSTAHRLLTTMAYEGFVQQERNSRSYRPGPALLELTLSSGGLQSLRQTARPIMEDLSVLCKETVQLLVLEGRSVRFLESIESDRAVRVTGRTGALLPVHATAGGKSLLAAMKPDEVKALLSSGLGRVTEQTTTNMASLLEELEDITRQGYAINMGESLEGLHAVAVPVRNAQGKTVASLAVSVPADRGGASRLRQHASAAHDAAERLGPLL